MVPRTSAQSASAPGVGSRPAPNLTGGRSLHESLQQSRVQPQDASSSLRQYYGFASASSSSSASAPSHIGFPARSSAPLRVAQINVKPAARAVASQPAYRVVPLGKISGWVEIALSRYNQGDFDQAFRDILRARNLCQASGTSTKMTEQVGFKVASELFKVSKKLDAQAGHDGIRLMKFSLLIKAAELGNPDAWEALNDLAQSEKTRHALVSVLAEIPLEKYRSLINFYRYISRADFEFQQVKDAIDMHNLL